MGVSIPRYFSLIVLVFSVPLQLVFDYADHDLGVLFDSLYCTNTLTMLVYSICAHSIHTQDILKHLREIRRPMNERMVKSILYQLLLAVEHLHTVCGTTHLSLF